MERIPIRCGTDSERNRMKTRLIDAEELKAELINRYQIGLISYIDDVLDTIDDIEEVKPLESKNFTLDDVVIKSTIKFPEIFKENKATRDDVAGIGTDEGWWRDYELYEMQND